MAQRQNSGTVIPFPRQPVGNPAAADSFDRLRRALAALDTALAAQRAAVSQWRGTMDDLGQNMSSLGSSLCSYQNALSGLDGRVSTLRAEALRLARWGDSIPGEMPLAAPATGQNADSENAR